MKICRWSRRIILMIFIAGACIEPYDPPLKDADVRYLVVDGFLNATESSATVRLTRTLPVKSTDPVPSEQGAVVRIEDDGGMSYLLAEISPGTYNGSISTADFESTYRLIIQTNDGHQYVSDFIELVETPAVDSITWSVANDGVEFAVTTHDPSGKSRHFRWEFIETYEYHSTYHSNYILGDNGTVISRPTDQMAKVCWKSNPSTGIMVATTKQLNSAIVSKFPLTLIPFGSIKLTVEYSVLVQQQTLTDEAYDYWLNLEKTTEHLGGLFDPLPSEVPGNIRSITHPGEAVIGFFSGSEVREARRFVKRSELPVNIQSLYRNPYCALDTILNAELEFAGPSTMLVDAIYPSGAPGGPIGYTTAEISCVDCTVRGGSKDKPSFWE